MSAVDLSPLLKNYEGQWVALSEDDSRVCGAGVTAPDAVRAAEANGCRDYTLLFVKPFDMLYCGVLLPRR